MEEPEMPVTAALPAEALNDIIKVLGTLDEEGRNRVLRSILAFFEYEGPLDKPIKSESATNINFPQRPLFSTDRSLSPKEFLMQKSPSTDVERIACLAYYITHFSGEQYFKTLDLAKLNTEAAMPKFSNSSYTSNNAVKLGYLVAGPNATRQLSAAGEKFVEALPDREAARAALRIARGRRVTAKKRKANA